ncbi:hypothetical protein VTN77DRAFT_7464 [Rasamsonia byssochlamydoides]|uniref:uncharacterized protein n=1 Tax=Rasamsonia byssochlamydoides TaxID=89139 RepID=UPI0037425CAC
MAENRQSLQDGSNQRFDMVQQPRRFACDRCRMQKLRCERDIWRPYLMPCKRCRKADMVCMITSTTNRSISKGSRQRVNPAVVAGTKAHDARNAPRETDCASKLSEQKSEKLSSSSCSDLRDIHDHERSAGPSSLPRMLIDPSNVPLKPDHILDDDSYQQTLDLEGMNAALFSGLITHPSDAELEHQIPYPGSTLHSDPHGWANLGESHEKIHGCINHLEYGTNCSTNGYDKKQTLKNDCRGKFLELNLLLMEYQHIVSQELAVLPSSRRVIPAANNYDSSTALSSAVQTVLRFSEQFLHSLTLSIPRVFSPSQALSASDTSTATQGFNQDHTQQLTVLPFSFDGCGWSQRAVTLPFHPQDARTDDYELSRGYSEVDIPTILVLINCYICLVWIYHAIFSRIFQDLVTCISPVDDHLAPTTLPGSSFPGFAVNTMDPSRELQLQVLFRACIHMLAQIEACLGLPERHCIITARRFEDGVLSNPVAVVLLDALASRGYGACGNGPGNGKKSLKEMIEIITQFLEPV